MAGKKGAERNFGTVEALAFAFILGFLPRGAVQIRKSEDNSDRKSNIPWSDSLPVIVFKNSRDSRSLENCGIQSKTHHIYGISVFEKS
ncbi:hypothetical protein [Paenibacillus etheri]|uniref:Uncharacterized protein n=1 Tax=Paenibacillus etheri TaxID=1306852 RepID=A0A0W1AQ83_9BACL|nr:hypothetical protein [Paenibacillus etheri]KTD83429.1 hypothetical protein UQ64_01990 [Paenibacillus etheri]